MKKRKSCTASSHLIVLFHFSFQSIEFIYHIVNSKLFPTEAPFTKVIQLHCDVFTATTDV